MDTAVQGAHEGQAERDQQARPRRLPTMLSFLERGRPSDDAGGPYGATTLLLRIYGIITIGYASVLTVWALVMGVLMVVVGAKADMWTDPLFGAVAGLTFVVTTIMVAFALAWAYWIGQAYRAWTTRDSAGPRHVSSLGLATILLAFFGGGPLVGTFAASVSTAFFLWGAASLLLVSTGIALMVLARHPSAKAVFGSDAADPSSNADA